MKTLFSIFLFIAILTSCEKSNDQPTVKGRIIYRSCATTMVQVLDSNYYHLGQDSWQQSSAKPVYRHVFSVANVCSFPNSVEAGWDIKFRIIKTDPRNSECVTCALYDNPPQRKQLITVLDQD